VLFTVTRVSSAPLTLPVTVIALLLTFYLALFIAGIPLDEAMSRGLLLGDLGAAEFQLISPAMLRSADWNAIAAQTGNFGILIGISLTSFLLYLTSLEVTVKSDLDINRELRNTGLMNIMTGLLSGMIGYLSLSLSTLTYRSGTRSRIVGITAGGVVTGIFVLGFSILTYFPLILVAGLLLFIGIDFLYEWLVSSWQRFSRIEYAVIVLILVVIALTDFLLGVLVGLAVMIVMFVVSYSRVKTIQQALTGGELQSNVDRNALQRRWLAERGHSIRILILRGFLFFGTANSIVHKLREILAAPAPQLPRYILLDFKNVTGLDTSAALSFIKIEHLAAEHDIGLVLTGLSKSQASLLERGGMTIEGEWVQRFPDLDRGLEWCEQQILENEQHPCDPLPDGISSQLAVLGFNERSINRLLNYLQPIDLSQGEYLIRKDDTPDALYYIEQGRVSVVLDKEDGEQIRLRSLTHGATVGEMGLYSGDPRSASVIADEATRVHRLSLEAMELMTEEEPDLLAAFHRWVAVSLSERLAQKSRSIGALHS
jgi:SulP family sulfate permease